MPRDYYTIDLQIWSREYYILNTKDYIGIDQLQILF